MTTNRPIDGALLCVISIWFIFVVNAATADDPQSLKEQARAAAAELTSVTSERAEQAKSRLRKLGPKVIPLLIELLNDHDDPEGVIRAIAVFGEATIPSVNDMLQSKDPKRRLWATRVLLAMADKDIKAASPALIDALKKEKNQQIRDYIIKCMSFTRDPRVLKPLLDLIESGPDDDRERSLYALADLKEVAAPAIPTLISFHNNLPEKDLIASGRWRNPIQTALASIGPKAIPAISTNVANVKLGENRRLSYLAMLDQMTFNTVDDRLKSAVPVLTELLRDDEQSIRSESARVLGGMGKIARNAIRPLKDFIRTERGDARLDAAYALYQIDNDELSTRMAIAIMVDALKEPDAGSRHKAAQLLGAMGDAAIVAAPQLTKSLADKNSTVRWAACRALGKVHATSAVPLLKRIQMNDPDESVRMEAKSAIDALMQD